MSGRTTIVAVCLLATAACAGPGSTATTTSPPPSTTTTTAMVTSTTLTEHETVEISLSPFSEMGPGWSEMFIPYGTEETLLGRSRNSEGRLVGPEYGIQTGDGRWWFLDTANHRVVRFDEQGEYLDAVAIPDALLVNGIMQYRMPQALDNGSIVAFGERGGGTSILTVSENQTYEAVISSDVVWELSDGIFMYGLDSDGTGFRLATWDGSLTHTDWFVARDRSRFRGRIENTQLHIELPDLGVTRTIRVRLAEQPELPVRFEVQIDSGVDGTLFILIHGSALSDPELKVGGLLSVTPDGTIERVQSVVNLFSSADPGSPAHLGVRPGTSSPWVMVVGDEGVHVFVRHN